MLNSFFGSLSQVNQGAPLPNANQPGPEAVVINPNPIAEALNDFNPDQLMPNSLLELAE
jgi:hypothetical protein